MMSNNNNNNTASSSNPLSKEAELKAFESSFFPAGGAPKLANIPQAPPAPKNLNNVRSKPINLKTRNWGGKLENGYSGINRSLYDRPNVFYWDSRPVLNERAHVLAPTNNNNLSNRTSSSSNIPQAPPLPQWNKQRSDNYLIHGKRLRIRNWGHPTSRGWSGRNKKLYNREGGLNLELNVIINELWAKFQPKNNGNMERGLEQPQFIQQPVMKSSLISTVTTTQVVPLVNATTVSVPMLNPPINDGRVYSKLYSQNTALTSGAGVTSIVKPRGTRRDHLVQPTSGLVGGIPLSTNTLPLGAPMIGTGTILTPGVAAVNRVPSKKELKTQQKLLKKQNKRDAKLIKKGIIQPAIPLAAPSLNPVSTTSIVEPAFANGGFVADRGLMTAGATTTGIIGPVATTVMGGSPAMIPTTNSFIKQDSFMNTPTVSLVGSPMM